MRWLAVPSIVGVLYLGLCAWLWVNQRRMLFAAPTERSHPRTGALLALADGTPALWMPPPPDGPVVVHFHGNAEQIGWLDGLGSSFTRQGVGWFAPEYPGYPGAPGSPTEATLVDAGRRALEQLTGPLGVSRERVILMGQSLGTGVAVRLASEGWGRALVLLSPYTSLADVAAAALPFVPARLLLRDRFDSMSRAPSIGVPTLVVHGTRDEVIPFDLGRALFQHIPTAKLIPIEGAGHNDLWDRGGALERVIEFVRLESTTSAGRTPSGDVSP